MADHYSITVDELIGHDKPVPQNPYENLTKAETVQMYFRKIVEDTRAMTVAMMKKPDEFLPTTADKDTKTVTPEKYYRGRQSGAEYDSFFTRIVNSPDSNFLVALMGNDENYCWLDTDADKLAYFFSLLGDPAAMKLMLALHTPGILHTFTAEYASELSGYPVEKVTQLLNMLGDSLNAANYYDAELEEGERRIYTYAGEGLILAMLNIAHEILQTGWAGDCIINTGVGYKPIKPVNIESKEDNT